MGRENRSPLQKESPRPLRRSACPVTPLTEAPGAKCQPQDGVAWTSNRSPSGGLDVPLLWSRGGTPPALADLYEISRDFFKKPDTRTRPRPATLPPADGGMPAWGFVLPPLGRLVAEFDRMES